MRSGEGNEPRVAKKRLLVSPKKDFVRRVRFRDSGFFVVQHVIAQTQNLYLGLGERKSIDLVHGLVSLVGTYLPKPTFESLVRAFHRALRCLRVG